MMSSDDEKSEPELLNSKFDSIVKSREKSREKRWKQNKLFLNIFNLFLYVISSII
jgi:hypothetical protein